MKKWGTALLAAVALAVGLTACRATSETGLTGNRLASLPDGTWQAVAVFPDWAGYVDDTLAMNSMYSFDGARGQGNLYISVAEGVESFDLFVNNVRVDTEGWEAGDYAVDLASVAVTGINTMQVTNIMPETAEQAVTVRIPYPVILEGTLEDAGIDPAPLELVSRIIESDIEHGFSSAQLAIIKDGRLVYQNAWGLTNSYEPDGTRIEGGTPVTNDTLYDLASNTKMYACAYAVQYLVDQGRLSLDDRIVDLVGSAFVDETLEIPFTIFSGEYPGLETIKKWKSRLTVRQIMMHQAGFPDSGHYHNEKFDIAGQQLSNETDNPLYVADATKEKTLKEGICRTPLIYEPGTATLYSDIDYMLLGLIVEKVTGQDLDVFLKETFWDPMGLTRIAYCPLQHGFSPEDCAATELNGNTRDGLVSFPGVRTETLQGEVHDEACYYTMEGVSGHAGLFASAADLARLASVMLTGGYGNDRFFSKDTRDLFIAPQAGGRPNFGIGWWRQGDGRRAWYYGTQAPDSTVGHQGWTGTLTMIDFENHLVAVYLTNRINTPVWDATSLANANQFSGNYYTSSTLGFVQQLLYMGLDTDGIDLSPALDSLLTDMIREKQKLVAQAETAAGAPLPDDHPIRRALEALQALKDEQ